MFIVGNREWVNLWSKNSSSINKIRFLHYDNLLHACMVHNIIWQFGYFKWSHIQGKMRPWASKGKYKYNLEKKSILETMRIEKNGHLWCWQGSSWDFFEYELSLLLVSWQVIIFLIHIGWTFSKRQPIFHPTNQRKLHHNYLMNKK